MFIEAMFFIHSAFAISPQQNNVVELTNTYNTVKDKIATEDQMSRKIMGSLYQINKRMKNVTEKRSELTDKLFSVINNVDSLEQNVLALNEIIKEQRLQLSRRLRTMYKMGGQGTLRILFSSQGAHEFDRNLKYLKKISDRDYVLIKRYQANLNKVEKKRNKLKSEVQHLTEIRQNIKEQEKILLVDQKSKVKLLTLLNHRKQKLVSEMQDIRIKTEKVAAKKILEESFFEQKGQLQKPISDGVITQNYGVIHDPDYRYLLSHKGVFFASALGSEVKGVFKGQVAYAGEVPGYGQTVIVDHGDHYYTVYAHNSVIKVKQGDQLATSQTVALTGKNIVNDETGVYFEIRHFSDAVNPTDWINDRKTLYGRQQ